HCPGAGNIRPGRVRSQYSRVGSKNSDDIGQPESPTAPDHEGLSLPPVDRGFAAWSFVVAGFMLETLVWGFGFTYGVFQEYFLHNRTFGDASEAEIGAVGTVALAIEYFEVLFVNMIALQWPHRVQYVFPPTCTLLMRGSDYLPILLDNDMVGFADETHDVDLPWTMLRKLTAREFCNQSIMFGIGGGGLYAPVIVYLSEWFSARRGLAAAIIFGGSGAGGACFPIAVNFLLSNLGFRWTLRIWAGFMLVFGALALAFTRPRLPVVRPQNTGGPTLDEINEAALGTVTTLIQALAYFPVSLYMTVYTASLGLPPLNGSLVLSVFNLSSQIIFGYACDIAPYQYVVIVSGAGAALSAYLLWGFAHSLGLIFAFVIIFGSLSGGFASVWPAVSMDIAGSEQSIFLNVYGLLTMTKGVAAVIGPLIAAALYHPEEAAVRNTYSGYGFKDVTLFVGSMMVATAAGGVAAQWAKRVVR
ncbi:hypothetical protein FRC11_003529, partial [Ceratobasidium sp. 423]